MACGLKASGTAKVKGVAFLRFPSQGPLPEARQDSEAKLLQLLLKSLKVCIRVEDFSELT